MRFTKSWLAISAVVVGVTLRTYSGARSSLDMRLERIENIVDSQVNGELLKQIDALQLEVQELRGKIEEQQHNLQLLSLKQDKIFTNLDSRLGGNTKSDILVEPAITSPKQVPEIKDIIDQVAEQQEQAVQQELQLDQTITE